MSACFSIEIHAEEWDLGVLFNMFEDLRKIDPQVHWNKNAIILHVDDGKRTVADFVPVFNEYDPCLADWEFYLDDEQFYYNKEE